MPPMTPEEKKRFSASLTPEQKNEFTRNVLKRDLKALCVGVLGMTKWDNDLHGWVARALAEPGKEKLFLLPRGHLKTSLMMGWAIQQILINPNVRILINNAVWDNARKTLSQIAGYLTDKSLLYSVFGNFKGPNCRWNQDHIEVAQRTKALAAPTIDTSGVEAAKTGQHYDIIINDDIVVRENVSTAEQIEKVMNFHRDCYALLDPGGIIVDVGTRWAMRDVYGQIIESNMRSINGHIFSNEEEKSDWRKYAAA